MTKTAQSFNLAEGDDIWILPLEATQENLESFLGNPWDFVERQPGMEAFRGKDVLFPEGVPITIQFVYNLPPNNGENPVFMVQGVANTNHITVQCPRFRSLPPDAALSPDEASKFVILRGGTDVVLKTLDEPFPVAYTHFEPSAELANIAANSARIAREPQLLAPFLNALRAGKSGHPVRDFELSSVDGVVQPQKESTEGGAVQYRMPDLEGGETFMFTYQTMLRRGALEGADIICYKVAGTYSVSSASGTRMVTLTHATQFLWGGNLWMEIVN